VRRTIRATRTAPRQPPSPRAKLACVLRIQIRAGWADSDLELDDQGSFAPAAVVRAGFRPAGRERNTPPDKARDNNDYVH
jgi:hypothetical protein